MTADATSTIVRAGTRVCGRAVLAIALAAALASPLAAQTQGSAVEGRVGRLESEMRAVQRKLFPAGAATTLVEPQITSANDPQRIGAPSTSAIADLTTRVTSLEQQMATMTGQIEQTQYRLRQLEDQFGAYKKSTDARLADGAGVIVPSAPRPVGSGSVTSRDDGKPTPRTGATATPSTGTSGSDRARQVAGVEKPDTGDAPEDAYLYGYRLWAAKMYPEAETQLKSVVATYPKHRRASYAQNLLGRSYLDDGKPSLASIAFYDNYKKYPEGERAPESLYYLGSALLKLNKPADACKVYGELNDVYGDKIGADMKVKVANARTAARCK